MIRFLLLLVVFCGGLVAAAVWYGQMHHLRLTVSDQLPAWSDQVVDNATLLNGAMLLPATSFRPAMTLGWTARLPGLDGLHWDVTLTGQGVDIQAHLSLPFWLDHAQFSDGSGTLLLADIAKDVGANGLVRVNRLTGRIDGLLNNPVQSGTLSASLQQIAIQGADLGDGSLRVDLDELGQIDGVIALRGGLTALDGTLSGTLGKALGQLDLTVADVTALPAAARGPLEALGQLDGTTVRLQLPLPLR